MRPCNKLGKGKVSEGSLLLCHLRKAKYITLYIELQETNKKKEVWIFGIAFWQELKTIEEFQVLLYFIKIA